MAALTKLLLIDEGSHFSELVHTNFEEYDFEKSRATSPVTHKQ
jgi:hypothetical protein